MDSDFQNPSVIQQALKINAGGLQVFAGTVQAASQVFLSANSGNTTIIGIDSGNANFLFSTPARFAGNVRLDGTFTNYNNINTAGIGVSAIYAATKTKTESASDASAATFTPATVGGSLIAKGNLDVSASASGVVAVTLDWFDANGTHHTAVPIKLYKVGVVAGSLGPTVTAGDTWNYSEEITVDGVHAVTVGFTLTSGTVTLKLTAKLVEEI